MIMFSEQRLMMILKGQMTTYTNNLYSEPSHLQSRQLDLKGHLCEYITYIFIYSERVNGPQLICTLTEWHSFFPQGIVLASFRSL